MSDERLDELAAIADELEQHGTRVEQLYARRLELWLDGQASRPKVTQLAMATASRVGESAICQALRKHERQLAEQTAGAAAAR